MTIISEEQGGNYCNKRAVKLQILFRNVVKGYGRMRLTSIEAEEMLKTADIDTDGMISYEEFVKLFCGKA